MVFTDQSPPLACVKCLMAYGIMGSARRLRHGLNHMPLVGGIIVQPRLKPIMHVLPGRARFATCSCRSDVLLTCANLHDWHTSIGMTEG